MDSAKPSMLARVLAVAVLVLVAVAALRLAVGFVVGLVSAVLWILCVAAVVIAALWARSTLKSAKRQRGLKRASAREVTAAPAEDPVAVEMRRITEQLREQGRR
jgi:threonine/homoserine/homoserine lactone efflux protein